MQKFSKYLLSFAILSFLALPMLALAVDDPFGTTYVNEQLGNTLTSADPKTVVVKVINIILGFLGLIAVGIVLLGGFKWMTAAGNEDKVSEAKKILGAGIIGLVIVLAAWAIAFFVINTFVEVTNNTTPAA